jgi:hypothetical protein
MATRLPRSLWSAHPEGQEDQEEGEEEEEEEEEEKDRPAPLTPPLSR